MEYTYEIEPFKTQFEQNFTWMGGFLRNVRRFPRRPALMDPQFGRTWTYARLNGECNRLANGLGAAGVGRGDLVVYQLQNCPAFAFCYLAPQKLGAVNSPINFNFAPGETARILDQYRPRAYVYDCDFRQAAWDALELCESKPALILAVDHAGERPALPEGHRFFDDYLAEFPDTEPARAFTPNLYDEVTRLFTSGTTGTPKAIPVNNVNEVLSAHDVLMHFPMNHTDVTMNMTPWFHRGGLHSGGLTPTLYAGGCCVALRRFNVKQCLDWSVRCGVTFLIGVPAILSSLADRQEKHPADLSHLKGIVTMGSPLDRASCIRFQRALTPNIFNGYGTTETFWNSFLRPDDLPGGAGTAGRSCTDDEVRVVRAYEDRRAEPEDTVPMDGESVGEIIISASFKSALTYVGNEALSREKYYKGWLYTHDLGTWDEEQFITVVTRKDDMLISRGENIYPAQVEDVLCRHPGVADCIVTGVPDRVRGEAVAAYVVRKDPGLTVQELNRFCVGHPDLSVYKCPRYYAFLDAVPYNASGKKLHYAAKERAKRDLEEGRLIRP